VRLELARDGARPSRDGGKGAHDRWYRGPDRLTDLDKHRSRRERAPTSTEDAAAANRKRGCAGLVERRAGATDPLADEPGYR
jgi:hypothetical protein